MSLRRVTFSGRFTRHDELDSNVRLVVVKGLVYMFLDVAITLGVSVALFYFFVKTAVVPYENDFDCGDESLRNPFYPNTVGLKHLLFVSLATPFFLIALVEAILFANSEGSNRLAKFFTTTTLIYLKYVLLYALCTFSMEFLKCYFGRLRPHFVEVCRPDWSKMDCTTDPTNIIPASGVVCLNPDYHRVRTARTSFPSGHTAAAVFVWMFYALYLVRMARATQLSSLASVRNLLLPLITGWTLLTAVTRVTDCWHHPTDVLGGFVLACVTILPFLWSSWRSPQQVYGPRKIEQLRPKFE